MGAVIEGQGIEKAFNERRSIRRLLRHPLTRLPPTHALRGVDLSVRRGEIFGLLGPNGAGKTTLIKIFCCLILPDRGRVTIDGIDSGDEREVKRRIGLVNSDERSFYWRLTARQNLRFFARLYNVPTRSVDRRIDELLAKVDLKDAADRRFSDFSSGMKQRVAIARALLHDPPILFMDEPTRSLDPATALRLREFMHDELKVRDGKTIVLATHNLREAEVLSDRLAILAAGRVRHLGTPAEIGRWGIEERQYVIDLRPGGGDVSGPFRLLSDVTGEGEGAVRRLTIVPHDGAGLDDVLRALHGGGASILDCDRVEPDLERAFTGILAAERDA